MPRMIDQYRKLKSDFRTPIKAWLHYHRILSGKIALIDKSGHEFPTSKDDLPIWEEYFSPKQCDVAIEKGLFRISPKDSSQKSYYIQGGNYKITYQPQRFFPEALNNPFFYRLQNAEKKVFSQHGEDGILDELFKMIPHPHQFLIEFGAHDGIKMSNSRYLITCHGWRAFLIEASSKLFAKLALVYPADAKVQVLESFVTVENINQLFKNAGAPKDFEFLSIDVDSIDYYLWEALTDFTPRVVAIECNSVIPPEQDYVVSVEKAFVSGGTALEGASFKSLVDLGRKKNYTLVYMELIGSNLFFVHNDYLKYLDGYTPMDPKLMYQPPQFGALADGAALNHRGY